MALQEKIRALPKNTVVLFCDETWLREFPPLRAAWAKQGRQSASMSGERCGKAEQRRERIWQP